MTFPKRLYYRTSRTGPFFSIESMVIRGKARRGADEVVLLFAFKGLKALT